MLIYYYFVNVESVVEYVSSLIRRGLVITKSIALTLSILIFIIIAIAVMVMLISGRRARYSCR